MFTPASRPKAVRLPLLRFAHCPDLSGDGARPPGRVGGVVPSPLPAATGAPVFTPASRPKAVRLPLLRSPIGRTYPGTARGHPDGRVASCHLHCLPRQERRCSHRHRGRRPRDSRCYVRPLPGPIRGRREATRTGGWRRAISIACRDRSAGVHTGIAAEGRETPATTFAHCPDPSGDGARPPGRVGGVAPSLLPPAPYGGLAMGVSSPCGGRCRSEDRRSFRRGVSCRRTEAVLASITSMKRVADHVSRPCLRCIPC